MEGIDVRVVLGTKEARGVVRMVVEVVVRMAAGVSVAVVGGREDVEGLMTGGVGEEIRRGAEWNLD